jgi:hypothetical protein
MARIKLLRNKRDIQIKQLRKEIAQLLTSGQEPSACIRVEHVYREENILAAYDILELFSELITVRLPIIESQKYVGLPSLLNSIFEMPSALFSSKILWCLKSENAFCSCRVKLARTRSVESASRRMRNGWNIDLILLYAF